MIKPYNGSKWERVKAAFLDYLAKHKAQAKTNRDHADNRLNEREIAYAEYRKEYTSLNAHLIGNGDYTNTGIRMRHGAPMPDKILNLTHHANGQPIAWRVEPMPLSDSDKLYRAQLKLAS